MDWSTVIFWLVVVGIGLTVVSIYNKLVLFKNRYQNAFAQIEVQLKRRYDLIPNLVETAKGYLKHEKETLEAVISARNSALAGLKSAAANPASGAALQELAGAEGVLAGALGKLSVVVEDYPDLKANENMMQLTEELTSTENRVSFARQSFNDCVTAYNSYKQTFPPVVFAGLFGHGKDASLLEFADSEAIQQAPNVSF
ncbi:LemA family protein [Porticoccus sp. GXU_MW_L64]